jgi:hypothetical protein
VRTPAGRGAEPCGVVSAGVNPCAWVAQQELYALGDNVADYAELKAAGSCGA